MEDLCNRFGEELVRVYEIEYCIYFIFDFVVIFSWDFFEKKMCNSSSDDGDECCCYLGRWF